MIFDGDVTPVVLVVDDDPQIRVVFGEFLSGWCCVLTADSGDAAFELMSDVVDVVLLDRRMPGLVGDDLLSRLRAGGFDQPVALVTAINPGFDILSLGFDDYLVKPVARVELRSMVEALCLRGGYDVVMREYFSLVSKVTTLQRERLPVELESHQEYLDSLGRLEEIKSRARKAIDAAIDSGEFDALFQSFPTDHE